MDACGKVLYLVRGSFASASQVNSKFSGYIDCACRFFGFMSVSKSSRIRENEHELTVRKHIHVIAML